MTAIRRIIAVVLAGTCSMFLVTPASPAYFSTSLTYTNSVFEEHVSYPGTRLENPWRDVTLWVQLREPEGISRTIQGFHYGGSEWRFRYTPTRPGELHWLAIMRVGLVETGAELARWEGSVTVVRGMGQSFLQIAGDRVATLRSSDSKPFWPLGIGDCILDYAGTGDPNVYAWSTDGGMQSGKWESQASLTTYARAYGKYGAGFDIFRWSVDNCSFKLWDTIAPNANRYLEREGRWGDELVQTLRANGFHIYMTIFGFDPPFAGQPNMLEQAALSEYVNYVAARYGAYVDVWELMNEATASDEWMQIVTDALRKADPYQHPIATSWEKPASPVIDIVAPHWYETEPVEVSDLRVMEQIAAYRVANKPLVFAEQGNTGRNWDPDSSTRMRIRAWTAAFNLATLIFWNTSYTKDYRAGTANLYIGSEERRQIASLQQYLPRLGNQVNAFSPRLAEQEHGSVRAYGLRANDAVSVYLVNSASLSSPADAEVEIEIGRSSVALWIDPATGSLIARQQVPSGFQRLRTPSFQVDLVLSIESAQASNADQNRLFVAIAPNDRLFD